MYSFVPMGKNTMMNLLGNDMGVQNNFPNVVNPHGMGVNPHYKTQLDLSNGPCMRGSNKCNFSKAGRPSICLDVHWGQSETCL